MSQVDAPIQTFRSARALLQARQTAMQGVTPDASKTVLYGPRLPPAPTSTAPPSEGGASATSARRTLPDEPVAKVCQAAHDAHTAIVQRTAGNLLARGAWAPRWHGSTTLLQAPPPVGGTVSAAIVYSGSNVADNDIIGK